MKSEPMTTDRASPRELEVVEKDQADSRVRQQQRADLAVLQGLAHEQHADHHRQRRIGKQNQALETGTDVAEANEVENAGAVVTEQAERNQRQPVTPGQRRRRATGVHRDDREEGQGEAHPQGEQGDRLDRHCLRDGVGELDEDRLERKAEGRQNRQRDPETFGRPIFPGHADGKKKK
jgi:hypothetical protein